MNRRPSGLLDFEKAVEGFLQFKLAAGISQRTHTSYKHDLDLFIILQGIAKLVQVQGKMQAGLRHLPVYLEINADWFEDMQEKIQATTSAVELAELWDSLIAPHIKQGVWTVLGTATNSSEYTMSLRRKLTGLVGADDANLLIANVGSGDDLLPSLGPVAGLARVAAGKMGEDDYIRKYGHRGPHEFEISKPRPVEDRQWIEQQLAVLSDAPVDVDALISNQQGKFNRAWERFANQYPNKKTSIHRQLTENTRRARLREEARSAYIRDRWLIRRFALRAGELLELRDDIFYLYLGELLGALRGDDGAIEFIPARKETYKEYLKLPSLPPVIRGRFDPFQWASNTQRRSDIFDAVRTGGQDATTKDVDLITGAPGSAGQVEGIVRVLTNLEEGVQFKEGEILVTTQTDISWTMLFPRAAAVVTDIGAPLSHAAIVARELGIPAVVGCGDATMRLNTGDHVRVSGGSGKVDIIERFMN